MTCDIQDRSIGDVLELLIEQGLDGTAEAISILLNEAMRLERERHLRILIYLNGHSGQCEHPVHARVGLSSFLA